VFLYNEPFDMTTLGAEGITSIQWGAKFNASALRGEVLKKIPAFDPKSVVAGRVRGRSGEERTQNPTLPRKTYN